MVGHGVRGCSVDVRPAIVRDRQVFSKNFFFFCSCRSHESANHPAAEAGLTVTLQQETWDLDENAATDTEIERRRVLLPLRRASDLTHRQFLTPPSKPERRFSR